MYVAAGQANSRLLVRPTAGSGRQWVGQTAGSETGARQRQILLNAHPERLKTGFRRQCCIATG
jgi:hypothetical protein